MPLPHRKATLNDLPAIIHLLIADNLGQMRETETSTIDPRYIDAFHRIDSDKNQYLMVVENGHSIIPTAHLTILPSLTFTGSTRLQIEAVRVAEPHRGQGIGAQLIQVAIEYGKNQGATIIQLTTNKKRARAQNFYAKLGFVASHEGMKIHV